MSNCNTFTLKALCSFTIKSPFNPQWFCYLFSRFSTFGTLDCGGESCQGLGFCSFLQKAFALIKVLPQFVGEN